MYFEEANLSVHGILIRKGATVFTIEPTETLANAAKSLTNHDIGALVVTNAEGYTVGIISERDIVRALGEKESAAFEAPVAEIMTGTVVFCNRAGWAGSPARQKGRARSCRGVIRVVVRGDLAQGAMGLRSTINGTEPA